MRIAIYSRVSTQEQNPENQIRQLKDYAKALNGGVKYEYIDYASGGKSDRAQFLKMLHDADRRRFDLLLIWSLDRLSREGISNTLGYLERLKKSGVAVKSLQESFLDTRDEGLGQILIAIFAWMAKQERLKISERVKASYERRRKEGKTKEDFGRKKGVKEDKERLRDNYKRRYNNSPSEWRKLWRRGYKTEQIKNMNDEEIREILSH